METYTEQDLRLQVECLTKQRDKFLSELEIARQALADYKKVCQNQQTTICELKDEIYATEVARYEYKS